MAKTLVIVESPAKVKTLSKFLGRQYTVRASVGHVRDLPKSQLGVDVDNGYAPKYITIRGKGDVIRELRESARKSDRILLATDPDREGEAISWHLAQILNVDPESNCRIEFNEITENAVKSAIKGPRRIHSGRVNAQQARRILDRLVGYNLSPFLWRKIRRGLSAGRVQSSALKLICDREREIAKFVSEEYWTITAVLSPDARGQRFQARLIAGDDGRIAKAEADKVASELDGVDYKVKSISVKEQAKRPAPPFTTSTLQQEAWRKLGFSAKRTMGIAQQLYEGVEVAGEGHVALITYMRTDSTRIAAEAQAAAGEYVKGRYGAEYVPNSPREYKAKSGAQDAHEAVRPTMVWRDPNGLSGALGRDQVRLYRLIWERFTASQMSDALYEAKTVDIAAGERLFRATGQTVKFPGFTALYTEGRDDEKSERPEEQALPELSEGQRLTLVELKPEQHFTQPPPRYTEATLVRTLEKNGVGRPSTYAPIIETLRKREYATTEKKHFKPTEIGLAVCDLLTSNFPSIVDLKFTARMEEELDQIEEGNAEWVATIEAFYRPFHESLEKADALVERVKVEDELTDEPCPLCGSMLVIKTGRYGKFIACPAYPECTYRRSMARKLDAKCPKCGGDMFERRSKKGRVFYGCANYPNCDFTSWMPPSGVDCPKCGAFATVRQGKTGDSYSCANPSCAHKWRVGKGSPDSAHSEANIVAE
ncbi:MAG: type I DNA topoisomerase [Clostridia bacterium]|nr:type I DNA topoisomerase [Clostridia bacterium]